MNIKIGEFDGPFELLFHLIEKNKIEITDIPIAFIADKFIESIEQIENENMNQMSEFIVMAATLLEIKSKILLPVKELDENGEEIDPRAELVERLIEYKRAKSIVQLLKESSDFGIVSRNPDKSTISKFRQNANVGLDKLLNNVTIQDLSDIFQTVILRSEYRLDMVRKDFNSIKKDEFTIENRIEYILKRILITNKIAFAKLFENDSTKSEKVTTFLAVLELIKINKIYVIQEDVFDNIMIYGV